jgi:hypothetical protein
MPEKLVGGDVICITGKKKHAHMTKKLVELDERLLLFFFIL